MATTKKITKKGNYKININSKSSDMVYTISSSKIAKGVHFNLVLDNASGFTYPIFQKSGNSLMIYSMSDKGKVVTTKITDYYKYYPSNHTILKFIGMDITPEFVKEYANNFDSAGSYYNNNTAKSAVLGKKGKNYYDMQKNKITEAIYDIGGNDTYNVTASYENKLTINDYAGNDSYRLAHGVRADVIDYKGNDNYDLYKNYAVNIEDRAGNDKYKIYYNDDDISIIDKAGNDKYNIDCNSEYVEITDNKGNDTYNFTYTWDSVDVIDKAGNDKYNAINAYYDLYIEDNNGNDTYKILYADEDVEILDKAGNDKYTITGVSDELDIYDTKGKDTYNLKDLGCSTHIYEDAGADKYNITNVYEYLYIYDGKSGSKGSGSDKYNLSNIYDAEIDDYYGKETYNINSTDYFSIEDYACNDVYTMKNSYGYIYDYGKAEKVGKKMDYTLANDKYNINHSRVSIEDTAGADKYNFAYNYGYGYTSSVVDHAGKDTYSAKNTVLNITDFSSSADKYTFTNSQGSVSDEGGADTYTAKNTTITINDYSSSSDKYNITGSKSTVINDKGGKDTYNIKDGANVTLVDETSSGDTYNITNTKNVYINDIGGKDTYKITSSDASIYDMSSSKGDSYTVNNVGKRVSISDGGGTGDILTISGAKKNNLIYMVDYDNNASEGHDSVNSGSLIIFDKTKGGYIKLDNFFSTYEAGDTYIKTNGTKEELKGNGYIETIKAGKTSVTNNVFSFATRYNLESWAEDIGAWLTTEGHAFGSVSSLLENGSQTQIKDFIAYCVDNKIA